MPLVFEKFFTKLGGQHAVPFSEPEPHVLTVWISTRATKYFLEHALV
eukprot:COSAG01_NODE_913_length_12779_cov_9.134385_8_plen_47_part_00